MQKNLSFFFKRLVGKLWFRPLIFCLLSIGGALIAHLADQSFLTDLVPNIDKSSLEDLLSTISASMLVIAIFAVGSMLSAFSAASSTATPRSFELVVADDVSQNALSTFVGAFIFSIVGSIALKNGYYGEAGYFTLFVLTILVFAGVILVFLRWVERISKLGRLEHTITRVEAATVRAFREELNTPRLGGVPDSARADRGQALFSSRIGYVQHIRMDKIQELAEELDLRVTLSALPGTFVSPDKSLLNFHSEKKPLSDEHKAAFDKAFVIENTRSFHNDPRFGLIALSEIASRALSPGINDPGTAIAIIGSHVRLFSIWLDKDAQPSSPDALYDRIEVPAIKMADAFEDAFRPIARDGAGSIEVMLRLQKAFTTIAHVGDREAKALASAYSEEAYRRAELAMEFGPDLDKLRSASLFAGEV
ncbi:MAG: DUF2254 domain-containing protein [Bacteroidetes bacterium]|nr:DUF2254 domain-containing protein [Bacteroidota bacterium]